MILAYLTPRRTAPTSSTPSFASLERTPSDEASPPCRSLNPLAKRIELWSDRRGHRDRDSSSGDAGSRLARDHCVARFQSRELQLGNSHRDEGKPNSETTNRPRDILINLSMNVSVDPGSLMRGSPAIAAPQFRPRSRDGKPSNSVRFHARSRPGSSGVAPFGARASTPGSPRDVLQLDRRRFGAKRGTWLDGTPELPLSVALGIHDARCLKCPLHHAAWSTFAAGQVTVCWPYSAIPFTRASQN